MNIFDSLLKSINPETKQAFSQTGQQLQKTFAPVIDFGTSMVQQNTQAIQPAVQKVKTFATDISSPIVKPIQQTIQKNDKITKANNFLAEKGVTFDDLSALAESEGVSREEVMNFLKSNGLNVQGMEQPQIKETQQPTGLDKFKLQSSEKFGVGEGIKDIGKFFVNLPADSAQVVGGLYDAVTHPIDTITGIAKVGQGLSDKAVFGIANSISSALGGKEVGPTQDAQMIDAIATHIKDTYGTAGKFKKAIVENPADTLLTLMGGLGAVSKVAEANNMTNVVSNINKLQEVINPVNVMSKPVNITGKILKTGGEALYKTAIKPTTVEAEKLLKYKAGLGEKPVTVADTALKTGIKGTETRIGVQGLREADKIFKEKVNPIFDKSTTEHSLTDLFKKAELKIDSMKEGELRKSELKDGLNALKEDYATIGKDKFSTKTLNEEKSSLDKFTPDKTFKGKPIASSYNEAKNILANIFREAVHNDLGKYGLKSQEAFRDYANLKELSKVGVKGLTEGGLKGGFGGFWTTMYDQIATPIKTIGGQVLYRVGNKLEFVGPKGINKFGDYLKGKISIDKNSLLNNNFKYAIPYLNNNPQNNTGNNKSVLKPKK